MPQQPSSQSPITATTLARHLAELSRLKDEFKLAQHTCVGGSDPVKEAEFNAWVKHLGRPDELEEQYVPRYRCCMEAFEAYSDKSNEVEFLPLLSPNLALAELAKLFPSLRDAPGLDPFDEVRFADWMKSDAPPQAVHAARLVLSVWENTPSTFNLIEAFQNWDDEHREAYVAWFQRPLMPQRQLWGEL